MNPEEEVSVVTLEESPLKKVVGKIKESWQRSSKKKKFVTLTLLIAAFTFIFLAFLIKTQKVPNPFGGDMGKDIILKQLSEGFERLKIPQRESPFFVLSTKTKSVYGILPQEVFVLTSKSSVDEDFLKGNIDSTTPVTISKVTSTEFEIKPQSALGKDEVFNVSLAVGGKESQGHKFDRNYGWTFQTQGKFRIKGTIPGNEKTNVPLNTGIEFTLSQDDFEDPKQFIGVTPSIAFRTEVHGEVFAIVPLQPLQPETIYTVTLKKGLNLRSRNDPIEEDFSFTFQTQTKEAFDKQGQAVSLSLSKNFIQVTPNENPIVGVYGQNWGSDKTVKTEIFKFPNGQAFVDSRKSIDDAESSWYDYFFSKDKVSTDGLSRVGTADLKFQSKEDIDFLELPSPLGEGFYLVQFSYEEGKRVEQLWLQSSQLSAYTSVGRRQSLAWVNNINTHLPADTAFITSPGTSLNSVTNDKGVSVFDTPSEFFTPGKHYIRISASEKELYLPVNSLAGSDAASKENRNDYWSYLYNERLLYKPGDTLYFWGVAKKRDGNLPPSSVTVGVPSNSYQDESKSFLVSTTVTPNSDGSFMGSISLGNLSQGWYSLELNDGELLLTQTNFEITDYQKPEMKIEVVPSKNAIFAGESLDFTGKVAFYDETPAKGIPLKIYSPDSANRETAGKTDNKGVFKYSYKSQYSGSSDYYPRYEGVTINPSLSEDSNIEGYGSVRVYGAKLMLTATSSQDGGRASFGGVVNMVDLTNINNGTSQDVRGGLVSGKEVKVTVTKTWWERKEIGTYYDFVEKVTRPSYQYERRDEKVVETKVVSDSKGEVKYDFDLEAQKSYHLEAELEDEDKHAVKVQRYFYYYNNYNGYQDDKYAVPEISLDKEENTFSLGEQVNLLIKYKGEGYKDTDQNRFLFIVADRGSQSSFVQDSPNLSFEFTSEYVPNIYVGSVIFTGSHYEIANTACSWNWRCSYYSYYYEDYYFNGLEIRYKEKDSELDVKVTSAQEKYAPGDTAVVKVNVKKGENGVEGADVNLVLVDAALEAIGGVRKPSVLSSLYTSIPSEIYYNYYSHKSLFSKPPAAEMGGGGEPREIFKDTAFFGRQRTDSNGDALFEFKLPDNITSWNIYSQAVSDSLDAGQGEGKLIATKDFFVTSNFPQKVLSKDKVFVTANSFGNAVSPNQSVSYDFYLTDGSREFGKMSKAGTTSKDVSFPVDTQTLGNYKAVLTGKVASLDDTLIYPLEVIDSRLDLESEKNFALKAGTKLSSLQLNGIRKDKSVKLVLTDAGKGKYYTQLVNYCFIGSNRLEKRIAKNEAIEIVSSHFGEKPCELSSEELAGFQDTDGGLSQVSWGGSDLKTSVWATFVNSDLFDKTNLQKYFEAQLNLGNSGTIQKIYSDWGLTLLGVPKVNDLRGLAQTATTFEEKVLVALALSSSGETELSRDLYFDILADYGYTNKPYIRIQRSQDNLQGSSENQLVEDSSYALLLGSIVEPSYNEGLYSYLRDYRYDASDVVTDLGKMAFIDQELSKLPAEDTNVSLKTPARNESYELKKGGMRAISLTGNEAENSEVNVTSGKADIRAIYFITPEALSQITKDTRLSVKRSYKNTSGNAPMKPGDIVEVNIDFNLDFDKSPRGGYEITDYLPSGLIYLDNPSLYGFSNASWVYQSAPGVVKYYFYNSPWWQRYGQKNIRYYARATSVGTYVGEPATIQSELDLSILNYTPEERMKIELE